MGLDVDKRCEVLMARASAMMFAPQEEDSSSRDPQWRIQLVNDLNEMLGRIIFQLGVDGDECDCDWAEAEFRVIERVAEFEEIEVKGGA